MSPSASEQLDEPRDQFNLGTMLLIAFAAIVGTTMTVWAFHFLHIETATAAFAKPFPRIAVLPFHSLSSSRDDIQSDQKLTSAMISGLARISRVEALPPEIDADPIVVGRETGVRMLLIGKIERNGSHLKVNVQMVSARDGKQLWRGAFEGDSRNLPGLSTQIDEAVAPHLTALLD